MLSPAAGRPGKTVAVGSSTTVLKNAHVWEVSSPLPVSYHSKFGDSRPGGSFFGMGGLTVSKTGEGTTFPLGSRDANGE